MKKTLLPVILGLSMLADRPIWGFFAHENINKLAVFTLPPGMIAFYKHNIEYISRAAVNPDKRRYVVAEEGPRHYLDVDHYGDSALFLLPRGWEEALITYGEDSLTAHGILPWHIYRMYQGLREAFLVRDPAVILKVSAELGHYVGDAHVPLHTTQNYNGQLTGQEGIHGLWESRLPEIFSERYNFLVGRAEYLKDPRATIWQVIDSTHRLVQRVLAEEKRLGAVYEEKKFAFETRGRATVRVYAREYAAEYHRSLEGMVEKQMRASVRMVGDLWFTAWVDAGQPDLDRLVDYHPTKEELEQYRQEVREWKTKSLNTRNHE